MQKSQGVEGVAAGRPPDVARLTAGAACMHKPAPDRDAGNRSGDAHHPCKPGGLLPQVPSFKQHERRQLGGRPSSGPKGLHAPPGQLDLGVAAACGMLAPAGQAFTAAVAGCAAGGSRDPATGRRRQLIEPSRIPAAAPAQCSSSGAAGRRIRSSGSRRNWDGGTPGCVLCCFTSLPSLLSRCLQNQLRPA
jgi:hypothetical protein